MRGETKMKRVILGLALSVACACGGGGSATINVDADGKDALTTPDLLAADGVMEVGGDSGVPDLYVPFDATDLADMELFVEPGAFGYPCETDDECLSGYCVQTPQGGVCTAECDGVCPEGWSCALHKESLPDSVFICVLPHMNLCKPCALNEDCLINGADAGESCITYGPEGSFCGGECADDAGCPDGYQCLQVEDVTGQAASVCMLTDGECLCAALFIEEMAATACAVENQYGSCQGTRQCTAEGLSPCEAKTPSEEMCNGSDDDCDGEIDEGTGGNPCQTKNEFGECEGTDSCAAGQLVCDAKEPSPDACDGLDNNCDGETDEQFPDTDGDGIKDCMETDKDDDGILDSEDNCVAVKNPGQGDFDLDGSGDACDADDDDDQVGDELDCQPFDSAVFPGAEEVCNGKDDNCNFEPDEGFNDNDSDGLADCVDDDDDDDGFADAGDCDPLDAGIFPGAEEQCDAADNDCDGFVDEGFADSDGDGQADCLDEDLDNDGIPNMDDNCPALANEAQEDTDGDGEGDLCDPDMDGDGIANGLDNCPLNFNAAQFDLDSDGLGDSCDEDADGDDVTDKDDNCVGVANPGQEDLDADGSGDACDEDDDGDGVQDGADNCPMTANPGQEDTDNDGIGDACEKDVDGDLVPDLQDNCIAVFNPGQEDCDGNGEGDACQADDDGDGVVDESDNCLCLANPGQEDMDEDDVGDACDPDVDGDGIHNGLDNCPGQFNPAQFDMDGDGEGDDCDVDKDGDGVLNDFDSCPLAPNLGQDDLDEDGLGDACDDDIDGDGDANDDDCAPLDPLFFSLADELCDGADNNCNGLVDEEFNDTDSDGLKDCVDSDDDNDLDPDETDCAPYDPEIHAGAAEACNGIDDNCNGPADEGFEPISCGLGDCLHTVAACVDGVAQYCNPYEGAVNEVCDGSDNDCDGEVDEDLPDLECGFGNCFHAEASCVDGEEQLCDPFAGAVDEVCDGTDNDCDGLVDEELGSTTCGQGECTHTVENCAGGMQQDCNPMEGAALEKCDNLDNNCNGDVDEDLGTTLCGQGECEHTVANCVNGAPQVCNPFADAQPELCDGLDNDCDGLVDENLGTTSCGLGECTHTVDNCVDGVPQLCDANEGAESEECDGKDNDCDGLLDEDLGNVTCGLGECEHSEPICTDGLPTVCDPFAGAVDEICDGKDNSCNGEVDDGLGSTTCGLGECEHTVANCEGGAPQVCNPLEGAVAETCSETDNDCDGDIDEEDAGGCDLYYLDEDGDEYGTAESKCLCAPDGDHDASLTGDCNDDDSGINPDADEICGNSIDEDCDEVADDGCIVFDCKKVLENDPDATSGNYQVDPDGDGGAAPVTVYCNMDFDSGGWTRVADNQHIYGTGYDSTKYNSQGFTYTEMLFMYDNGSSHAHCTYPGSIPGCNNIGIRQGTHAGNNGWGGALNWGSSTCGMSVFTYSNTTYFTGTYHFKVKVDSNKQTIQTGTLEGISGCTIGDNPGSAYMDIYVR